MAKSPIFLCMWRQDDIIVDHHDKFKIQITPEKGKEVFAFRVRIFLSPPPEGGLDLVTNRQDAI